MDDSTLASIAYGLFAKFLENGNYTYVGPLSGPSLSNLHAAAAASNEVEGYFEQGGFAGLAVQSVGYELHRHDDLPPKIHIYVTKGSRKAELELKDSIGGEVAIQINRIGRVIVRPEMASGATNRGNIFVHNNRVACGSSCAPSGENYAGTMGALVTKHQRLYVLSNNHVIAACNHTPLGTPILAPANMDGRPGARAPGEVCRHSEICELRSGTQALVQPLREDAALAEVVDSNLVTSWQGDDANGFDTPSQVAPLFSGMAVKKVGRTTGLTTGTVEATLTPFAIPYKSRHFTATVWFQDAWSVRGTNGSHFALQGDSGSLVVDNDGGGAVGLVFAVAGSGDYAIIIPMTHVVGLFGGIALVGNHGA
jgi:hypothetical protein